MDVYNPTTARERLYSLIEAVNTSREPVIIRGKKGDAVFAFAQGLPRHGGNHIFVARWYGAGIA